MRNPRFQKIRSIIFGALIVTVAFVRLIKFVILPLCIVFMGYAWHWLKVDRQKIESLAIDLSSYQRTMESKRREAPVKDKERMSTSWLAVQKQVKDTVVQVHSQVLERNLLEPYRAPEHGRGSGTGFFINAEGDLITNWHVVGQSSSIQITVSSCGQELFDAELLGVSPERDIALVALTSESRERLRRKISEIPYLELGDSDDVLRSQEVLALGYPLGQSRLKSTLGIVSGRERLGYFGYIQITAPLNPGNSGGPALDLNGNVIGINSRGVTEAQNVGYIIPINEVKSALDDLRKVKLLRKPVLGCIFTTATNELVQYLNNPDPGGWYIAKVFEDTLLEEAGIKSEDMLYEINGHRVDVHGEMNVPWSEDKVSLFELLNRYTIGDKLHMVIYRKGQRKEFNFVLEQKYLPPVRTIYPDFEPGCLDYEIVGGMVLMQMSLNHVGMLLNRSPELVRYGKPENQHEQAVIITHVLPNSQAYKARVITAGDTIKKFNGQPVKTLDEIRQSVLDHAKKEYVTVETDHELFAALSIDKIINEEQQLADRYFIPRSKVVEEVRVRRAS